ncbi:MAG TPA: LysE family transporter [Verrucomicrobiota bacterium]|nr:LysE family transporter [Verrucomicrobiota bacterium]HNT16029.1 LysE family transporter [Verrucomicrobiota bacterium]
MPELPPFLVAALTGFLAGVALSIPVGPVNITILNEGARRGFKWAAMIGMGATLMEMIYCAIAFTGFAAIFENGLIKALMEVFSFAFMLFLGVKFLLSKSVPTMARMEHRIELKLEQRLHPHSAFMTGFVRTLANPGVLLGWIVLGAIFISRGLVRPDWEGKLACLAGVTAGVGLWFLCLSWAISLGQKKFTDKTLLKMERISGACLVVFALFQGVFLAMRLTNHRM